MRVNIHELEEMMCVDLGTFEVNMNVVSCVQFILLRMAVQYSTVCAYVSMYSRTSQLRPPMGPVEVQ